MNCRSIRGAIVFSVLVIPYPCVRAQTLLMYYDFEGDSPTNVEDVSGYLDASGIEVPANGVLSDPGASPNNASIVADTIDPTRRGDVLKTASSGYGAQIAHTRKMDFRNSYTISAWFRSADSLAYWQEVAGMGDGPRLFAPHWGLGGVAAGKMTNELLWSFGLDSGFEPVQLVSPTGFVDGTQWHHVLVSWNAGTKELWGYFDGFDGGDPNDAGLSPVQTDGDTLLARPGATFMIGDPQDGPLSGPFNDSNPHPDFWIDDVAFWQGYAPPNVVAGLYDGSISVHDAASMMELPTATADIDGDGDVDGADFLRLQRGFGQDDLTPFAVTVGDGDANGDLKVDGLDIDLWQEQYGTVPSSSPLAVPEPHSCLITMFGVLALMMYRRRLS